MTTYGRWSTWTVGTCVVLALIAWVITSCASLDQTTETEDKKVTNSGGGEEVSGGPEEKRDPLLVPVKGKPEEKKWTTAVEPKPLSDNAKRGLAWLVKHQHDNGGWSQGEEASGMGGRGSMSDKTNVADTSMAVLALLRSGSTPVDGEYAESIRKGIEYVCNEVKESDDKSLFVTKTKGTRLQSKLGTYIDTFLASMLLSQVKGKMQNEAEEKMVLAALDKVMDKIEKNQKEDGTFGGTGWANTLSQSMAAKGINLAAQSGYEVNEEVRARAEQYARRQYDGKSGKFSSAKSAGVDLYSSAATLSGMQDSDNTNGDKEQQVREQMEKAKDDMVRKKLQDTLDRYKDNRNDLAAAKKAVVKKLENKQFIAGFGSNGGEEFLSYMNIGESLVVDGGDDWDKWDGEITKNLNRIQNADGSWTGHHCITGRSFCTSAALLVLMTDRTQVPVAAKVAKR